MKTNSSVVCTDNGGSGALATGSYAAFATYLSNYIASMQTYYSIPLYAISVQNEPDVCPPYDGALMSAAQYDTFIKSNLGPTLSANGQTSTLIVMPETGSYAHLTTYAGTCMGDSSCAAYVGIDAFHQYDNPTSPSNPYASSGKLYWETEVSSTGAFDPSIADALKWALELHTVMVNNANVWQWWNTQQAPSSTANYGLYGSDNATIATRAYAIGNWSKYVRPGWVRIDATANPVSGVYITAFKDPTNTQVAIVALNSGSSWQSITVSLSGAPTFTSVTPVLTSGSASLAPQSAVSVSSNSFTYTLPASSVTTFVGVAGDTNPAPVVSPPTHLTTTVK